MPEPITTQLVADVLEQLMVAFPRGKNAGTPHQLADVYRNGLVGLSGDALRWAARTSVQEDTYFPKVSRLRDLATRWQRTNQATVEAQITRPSGWCEGCQSVAKWEQRWRPRITDKGQRILDAAGRLWLEQYERYVCKCNAPCAYAPDDEDTDYMTQSGRPAA